MKLHNVRSLGGRLSAWLALQTVVGLALVSLGVYWATSAMVQARQAAWLNQKQAVVSHVFDEVQRGGGMPELRHKLDDFFIGNLELTLVVQAADGSAIYRSDVAPPARFALRSRDFVVPTPTGLQGPATARLTLKTDADDELLRRLALILLAATLLGAAVVSAGGWALVRAGLAPLHQLVNQTRRLAADSLRQTLDGSAQPRELQPLIEQFNALLLRLGMAYEQLEGFNADVAHELLTPITTMISSTELGLRKTRSADELRDVLGSNLEELQRMAGIVNDMLFLSQADRGAKARRESTVSLAELAHGVIDYHAAALDEAGLRVRVQGDAGGAFDLPLLRRVLSNLLGNATRYADEGSEVRIELTTVGVNRVELAVVNEGQTIAPSHLPRLFDRFYRSDPSRSQVDRNHGLGLAIVAAVARMHGGSVGARSAHGITRVAVEFAAAD